MGTFTQSTIFIQNCFISDFSLYDVVQRDVTSVVLRNGTQITTSSKPFTLNTDTDTDVNAWLISVFAYNRTTVSAARQALVHDLVTGLKSDGIWSKLDRLWLFSNESPASALIDLVSRSAATLVGAPSVPVFTADRGFQGNGTTQYINTGYDATVNAVNFSQNSAHISAWAVTARSVGSGAIIGANNTNINVFFTLNSDSNVYGRINDSSSSGAQGVPGTSTGLIMANRSGASASQIYLNGSLFSSPNATSTVNTGATISVLATGAGASPTNCQCAMASMGGSLSGTDATNYYNRLRTYMTAVGVP